MWFHTVVLNLAPPPTPQLHGVLQVSECVVFGSLILEFPGIEKQSLSCFNLHPPLLFFNGQEEKDKTRNTLYLLNDDWIQHSQPNFQMRRLRLRE